MVEIESYTKLRRAKGRITKGLYNQIKKIEDAVNNIESPNLSELLEEYNIPEIKTVEVNVNTGNANGSSSADEDLINATIIGVVANGNQDQFIKEILVGEEGQITVSLLESATAQNKFIVSILKSRE